jgi:hypothetical protein
LQVYVFLDNVDQEKVETTFKPTSVDIKFHDVKGKNYRCAIPKLNKEIVPEKCKIVVKPTKIVITLWKASTGSWLDLHYKEDKVIAMPMPSYALVHSVMLIEWQFFNFLKSLTACIVQRHLKYY